MMLHHSPKTLEHLLGAKGLLRSVKGQTQAFRVVPGVAVFCAVVFNVLRACRIFVFSREEIQLHSPKGIF